MAEFCKDCAEVDFGPDPVFNDFLHFESIQMALCEGCGIHWFDAGGKRSHPIEGDPAAQPERCPVCFPEGVKV